VVEGSEPAGLIGTAAVIQRQRNPHLEKARRYHPGQCPQAMPGDLILFRPPSGRKTQPEAFFLRGFKMPQETPFEALIKGVGPSLVGSNIIGGPGGSGHQSHGWVHGHGKIAGVMNEGSETGGKLNQRARVKVAGLAIVADSFPEHGNVEIGYQCARLPEVVSPELREVKKAHADTQYLVSKLETFSPMTVSRANE